MDDCLRPARSSFCRKTASVFAILVSLGWTLSAATLVTHPLAREHVPHPNAHQVNVLNQFLAGGVDHWINAKPPRIPGGVTIRYADGTLKHTPLVSYLEWRRAQDPNFFDHRHPYLAYILTHASTRTTSTTSALSVSRVFPTSAQSNAREELAEVTSRASVRSRTPVDAEQVLAQNIAPAPVPEPAGALAMALLFGTAAWWRRRAANS